MSSMECGGMALAEARAAAPWGRPLALLGSQESLMIDGMVWLAQPKAEAGRLPHCY
jgi:hypothetical protein